MTHEALLIDISPTDCRMSILQQQQAGRPRFAHNIELTSSDFSGLDRAIEHYATVTGLGALPKAVGIGVMGVVRDGRNEPRWATWNFTVDSLRARFNFDEVLLVNDVAALAAALPWLSGKELVPLIQRPLRKQAVSGTGRYAVINSNFGLGVAALNHSKRGYEIIDSEAGHSTFGAQTPMEIEILKRLSKLFDRVSYEHLLSLPGLVNLYRSICEIRDLAASSLTAIEIILYGQTNADPACRAALDTYFSVLGSFAGDIAINLAAESGIFISSPIVHKTGDFIEHTEFRSRFDFKGHMAAFVGGIPTHLINNRSARLVGLARLVTEALSEKDEQRLSARNLSAVFTEAMAAVDQTVILVDPDLKILSAMIADWYDSELSNGILKIGADFPQALEQLDKLGLLGLAPGSGGVPAIVAKLRAGESFTVERRLFGGRIAEMLSRPRENGGHVIVEKDVTELRRRTGELEDLARNLRAASSKAEAGSRAKSQFLANMSHEIRTPLNGVLGMADVLRRTPLSGEQKDMLDIIISSGHGLLNVINDILDFSKIEAGKMSLVKAPFNLEILTEDVGAMFSAQAATKGLELMIRCRPGLPVHLIGDHGRLRQILTNVVGNAIKFTDKGHIYVDVGGQAANGQATITIDVCDTGCGIPSDKLSSIFEMFEQVDGSATRYHDGTGLGLSITRRLLDLMGGEICVESQVGVGTRFAITLSLAVAGDLPAAAAKPVDLDLRGRIVLIIDDKPINRQILEEQTRNWDMAPIAVANAREALEFLRGSEGRRTSLAILDYQMPGQNGIELAQAIKRDANLTSLPLILLSSIGHLVEPAESASLFAAVLAKPARASALRQAIGSILAKANSIPASPISPAPATDPSLKVADAPATQSAAPAKPLKILVADDNAINHTLIRAMLANGGYEIETAHDGKRAVEIYRSALPDIVLMDVSMPKLDGLQATAQIRRFEQTLGRRAMIVGLTAHAMNEDRQACLSAGMDDYLAKPISRDQLVAAIAARAR